MQNREPAGTTWSTSKAEDPEWAPAAVEEDPGGSRTLVNQAVWTTIVRCKGACLSAGQLAEAQPVGNQLAPVVKCGCKAPRNPRGARISHFTATFLPCVMTQFPSTLCRVTPLVKGF